MIGTPRATSAEVCELLCFMEITCQSCNFGPKEAGGYVCELSDSDAIRDLLDWTTNEGSFTVEQRYEAFLDYKWSSVCNFTKYTAVSRLSRV